jgi:hypothetical protein
MSVLDDRPSVQGIGSALYSRKAWRQLAAMPQAEIEMTYDQYLRKTRRLQKQFAAKGLKTTLVPIDEIDAMVTWCRRHGYEINRHGRVAYSSVLGIAGGDPNVAKDIAFTDNTRSLQ